MALILEYQALFWNDGRRKASSGERQIGQREFSILETGLAKRAGRFGPHRTI